jgi:hypothetical protein
MALVWFNIGLPLHTNPTIPYALFVSYSKSIYFIIEAPLPRLSMCTRRWIWFPPKLQSVSHPLTLQYLGAATCTALDGSGESPEMVHTHRHWCGAIGVGAKLLVNATTYVEWSFGGSLRLWRFSKNHKCVGNTYFPYHTHPSCHMTVNSSKLDHNYVHLLSNALTCRVVSIEKCQRGVIVCM